MGLFTFSLVLFERQEIITFHLVGCQKSMGLFTFSLVLFERQEIITFHLVGCQNKCHLVMVTACLIPKSLRFRSVLNFRVATKILFYQNSIAKFICFYFCVPFSLIKSYNNSCKVFSRSEQETGKRKHKEPPINPRSKKIS